MIVFSGGTGAILATMVGSSANGNWGLAESDLPVIGDVDGDGYRDFAVLTISGRDAPPGTMGTVALSRKPLAELNLGVVGCNAWFDVSNWTILFAPPGTASWSLTFPVPGAPQLAGTEVALQAFYLPTTSPIGFDLSNGIWARIGY